MDFSLSEEQQMLLESTRRLIASQYGFDQRARVMESEAGWSRDAWRQLADLGLLMVDIPEDQGGIGAGPVGVMLVSQAIGEGLLLEPFHASAVLATQAILRLGSDAQRARWLPALGSGETIAALAHEEDESRGHRPVTATRSGEGWILTGTKHGVYHAGAADLLLVTALTGEGERGVFAVQAGAQGLRLRRYTTVDGQPAADVELANVTIAGDARLGGDASQALQAVLDHGIAALCAEALGVLDRTLKATIEYSRSRVQFGVPIGSFQALQHRMADMLMHVEQARSMATLVTSRCIEADPAQRRAAASAAKLLIGQAARFVGQQAVQLHGGMGMSDELDVSHCFKRLLAFELRLGTTDEHMHAYASRELMA
ncbi:MAG: acyl-CoA dehydrogenase [Pseudomonadota bacterium]|nr:acyl-CoA dehydrogenase [Pseudomonadota bacterium]